MIESIKLGVFSGTGNTLIASKHFQKHFESTFNKKCELFSIGSNTNIDMDLNNDKETVFGFGIPVICGYTYPFILKFFQNLPKVNSSKTPKKPKVFILSTYGRVQQFENNGKFLKENFEKKGYEFIGIKSFPFPHNIAPNVTNQFKNSFIMPKVYGDIEEFCEKLYKEEVIEKKVEEENNETKFEDFEEIAEKVMEKINPLKSFISVNVNKCEGCGLCKEICPKDNFKFRIHPKKKDKKIIIIKKLDDCESCLSCFAYCPKNAIEFNYPFKKKLELVSKMEKFSNWPPLKDNEIKNKNIWPLCDLEEFTLFKKQ